LDKENDAAKKLPPRIGLTLAEFVEEWRTNIAVNLKGTTTRAAESHLRAHIIPKLGNYHLPEIMTKIVQGFVAYLAGGGRSRKTTENVLLCAVAGKDRIFSWLLSLCCLVPQPHRWKFAVWL